MTIPAVFVLEDGTYFHGVGFGAQGSAFGEAVFSTGMSGYQETLTDPSYHRQVVVMTAPHIGNTGMNRADKESSRIWVSGFVVREISPVVSNWRSETSLDRELFEAGVVGVAEVDTRAITRHLRERGAMRVGLFSGEAASLPIDQLVAQVQAQPGMAGLNLTSDVSTQKPYVVAAVGPTRFKVAALDLGIKSMTPEMMAARGIEVHVFPSDTKAVQLLDDQFDGVFFSNGPGDPASATHAISVAREVLAAKRPFFGICFGNQILGRALGFDTYKLKYGHRGINQPVQDRTTGKVEVTAHNHGVAVSAPLDQQSMTEFGRVVVSHVCLNDDVVEGLQCLDTPAFSVQYHPEAAAGPHDSAYLFDRFCDLMEGVR
jgi:carbamoyl-phosphate synthase small subunit